jgi:flagellar hook-associated protein 1 FlgK
MSGIGAVLDLARWALVTQQTAIQITGHNIANVNTPGYSRQSPVIETQRAQSVGAGQIGRGCEITEIRNAYDEFINKRIHTKTSTLFDLDVKKNYMESIELIFNETSDYGLSSMLNLFWAAWEDLAVNPASTPERQTLLERGELLVETLQGMHQDLENLNQEINLKVSTAVSQVNDLAEQIAEINLRISEAEITGKPANDLRDKRSVLVEELSQFVGVNYLEDDNGMLSVFVGKGGVLVQGADYNTLDAAQDSDGNYQVNLVVGQSEIQITDSLSGGKLGGWVTLRDQTIPGYEDELDALAEALIKEINRQHSQGVGLEALTEVTGTYAADDENEELGTGDSGLDFYNEIVDGSFRFWVFDSNGDVVGDKPITITVDRDVTTLEALKDTINAINNISASVTTDKKLKIEAEGGYSFGFSNDTSNVLMALGINTFFDGTDASTIDINTLISSNLSNIAAARMDYNMEEAVGTGDGNEVSFTLDSSPIEADSETIHFTGEAVGTGDGVTTAFNLDFFSIVGNSQKIYVDNVLLTEGVHYTINDSTGQIDFTGGSDPLGAPAGGAVITADYSIAGDNGYIIDDNTGLISFIKPPETGVSITADYRIKEAFSPGDNRNALDIVDLKDASYTITVSGTCASLTTSINGTNNDLIYAAVTTGSSGNDITIEYVVSDFDSPPVVTVTGSAITVTIDDDSFNTANDVKRAIGNSAEASALVTVINATGNDGSGTVGTMTATSLSSGTADSSTCTLGDFLNSLVGEIGIDADGASRSYTFHEALMEDFNETREGIQGVNLDEEMTNLIRYQHAYEAAAKLISVCDEMLAALLATR